MDRLLSAFNAYDIFGYILCGALVLAGSYWAFEDEFLPLTTAGTLGVVGLAYLCGHAVQSLANLTLEPLLWWSTDPRHKPASILLGNRKHKQQLDAAQRAALCESLEASTHKRPDDHSEPANRLRFAAARAALHAEGKDARAELMSVMYGLCRGATTACAMLVVICIAAGCVVDGAWSRLGVAIAILSAGAILLGIRTRRFGFYFARQIMDDYLTLP